MCGCFSWKGSPAHHHLISKVFSSAPVCSAHKRLSAEMILFLIFCILELTWNGLVWTMWLYVVRHLLAISLSVCHTFTLDRILHFFCIWLLFSETSNPSCNASLSFTAQNTLSLYSAQFCYLWRRFLYSPQLFETHSLAFIGKDGDIRITLTGRFSHIIILRQRGLIVVASLKRLAFFFRFLGCTVLQDDLLLDQSHFPTLNRSF